VDLRARARRRCAGGQPGRGAGPVFAGAAVSA
jgi:hypothetical protein